MELEIPCKHWTFLRAWSWQWWGICRRSAGGARLLAQGEAHGVASWHNRARHGQTGEDTETGPDEDKKARDDEDEVGSGTSVGAWGLGV